MYNGNILIFGDETGLNQYFENNQQLNSELRTIKYQYQNFDFIFYSDLGVFSKDHIDYGSMFLVETILSFKKTVNSVLDIGAGYGYLGIVLSKVLESSVTMTDVNERAVHLCEKNIKENHIDGKAMISNCYDNINNKYDLIVSNPPIRAGKKIVLEVLIGSKNYLKPGGELWFVIRKDQGAKSIVKEVEKHLKVELLKKSKGFYVFFAKSN